ncbi:hypothetical protein ACVFYP_27560 [Roseomonas sp. F4]
MTNSGSPIILACDAPGHATGRAIVPSVTNAGTAGLYILAGGLVGLAAASATGAMYDYPSEATVVLVPESFPSAESRDAFFAPLVAGLNTAAGGTADPASPHGVEIARLETLRASTRIVQ